MQDVGGDADDADKAVTAVPSAAVNPSEDVGGSDKNVKDVEKPKGDESRLKGDDFFDGLSQLVIDDDQVVLAGLEAVAKINVPAPNPDVVGEKSDALHTDEETEDTVSDTPLLDKRKRAPALKSPFVDFGSADVGSTPMELMSSGSQSAGDDRDFKMVTYVKGLYALNDAFADPDKTLKTPPLIPPPPSTSEIELLQDGYQSFLLVDLTKMLAPLIPIWYLKIDSKNHRDESPFLLGSTRSVRLSFPREQRPYQSRKTYRIAKADLHSLNFFSFRSNSQRTPLFLLLLRMLPSRLSWNASSKPPERTALIGETGTGMSPGAPSVSTSSIPLWVSLPELHQSLFVWKLLRAAQGMKYGPEEEQRHSICLEIFCYGSAAVAALALCPSLGPASILLEPAC
ncbi:hypothetical protein F8388_015896 [Cannabis sativa]|uniref:Uncharacterized protein n=1 Tax=Cannabis sativa TaxID=3483 RepID=A0A7J6FYM9_CANSA|nr:hypothetical protein F8388_015896 [Cannabis sativa]